MVQILFATKYLLMLPDFPLIIADESLQNIQEIRKRFAYRWATKQFYSGKEYDKMKKMGGGIPPTFDEKILEPWIQQCLKPLPIAAIKVKTLKGDDGSTYKGSKALTKDENPNFIFKDETAEGRVRTVGKMPDKLVN